MARNTEEGDLLINNHTCNLIFFTRNFINYFTIRHFIELIFICFDQFLKRIGTRICHFLNHIFWRTWLEGVRVKACESEKLEIYQANREVESDKQYKRRDSKREREKGKKAEKIEV